MSGFFKSSPKDTPLPPCRPFTDCVGEYILPAVAPVIGPVLCRGRELTLSGIVDFLAHPKRCGYLFARDAQFYVPLIAEADKDGKQVTAWRLIDDRDLLCLKALRDVAETNAPSVKLVREAVDALVPPRWLAEKLHRESNASGGFDRTLVQAGNQLLPLVCTPVDEAALREQMEPDRAPRDAAITPEKRAFVDNPLHDLTMKAANLWTGANHG